MKYAMLIYPKLGSHEGLGEEEAKALTAEYLALRDDSRCVGGATCSRATRRPRFAVGAPRI